MHKDNLSEENLILLMVFQRLIHGYGAAKQVYELSNGRYRIPPGTLYGILNKMTENNLIAKYGETFVGNKKKTLYLITENGKIVLEENIKRIYALSEIIKEGMKLKDD